MLDVGCPAWGPLVRRTQPTSDCRRRTPALSSNASTVAGGTGWVAHCRQRHRGRRNLAGLNPCSWPKASVQLVQRASHRILPSLLQRCQGHTSFGPCSVGGVGLLCRIGRGLSPCPACAGSWRISQTAPRHRRIHIPRIGCPPTSVGAAVFYAGHKGNAMAPS